ncbi:protein-methionine-sulfoxide reductase heme-binding subunit MsrQ [Loktanella sp. F6476L]|uniref:protein-methionine-sulfoxide reductase heme-binding subunit MsrQ n=1 Tax=Loktanella sp. F6476L TaxID=2926405 RepID=UPI001FF63352|nr:protein-methionine-sulfoxide reductase heme-binding subunit MsrQ [Loktanella sp. F6476L]MCK0121075.1 protein-methionine-sulfoxide reductase heme-binding subunit MsrQ [Loktanella sp. F6476L]
MIDTLNTTLRRIPAWTIYIVGAAWAAWLFYLGLTGGLGPEPINALEREYGEVGLKLLIAGLAVTPLRKFAGLNLLKFRRALGVTTFFYIVAHFSVWAFLDVQSFARVWEEIVKRPYVTVGMLSFVMMIPLAVTSNNMSLRKMGGAAWRKLHKLTYPIAVLGAVHYLWLVKGFQIEPIIYLMVILGLLATRIQWAKRTVPA